MNDEVSRTIPGYNVFKGKSGCTPKTLRSINPSDEYSAFNILFDASMLRHVSKCTEREAQRRLGADTWRISIDELQAFIGLLFIRGACCASNIPLTKLWYRNSGNGNFFSTMSRDRFKDIMRYLRFDDKSTRSERLKNDKFTMISWLFDRIIENF